MKWLRYVWVAPLFLDQSVVGRVEAKKLIAARSYCNKLIFGRSVFAETPPRDKIKKKTWHHTRKNHGPPRKPEEINSFIDQNLKIGGTYIYGGWAHIYIQIWIIEITNPWAAYDLERPWAASTTDSPSAGCTMWQRSKVIGALTCRGWSGCGRSVDLGHLGAY